MTLGLVVRIVGCVAVVLQVAPHAQTQEPPRSAEALNVLQKPGTLPFSSGLLRALRVPPGFEVNILAAPKGNARMMAVDEDGTIYLTRQEEGDVLLLRDRDGDGQAEEMRTAATGLELVHGITIHNHVVYLVSPKNVWSAAIGADGSLEVPQLIIDDLPDGGQHRARSIAVGPDEMLYIGVGSTCNACDETNPQNATIQRALLDGSGRTTFAAGLRHTIGFGWQPLTGELWGWDNGSDSRGNRTPREELNQIVEGGNYGWPFCFENRRVDPLLSEGPKGRTREDYCAQTLPPALTYTAHSAPIGFTFYRAAQFPADYHGDAFLALRGSWNRRPPSGYKVVRVHFEGGAPVSVDNFLTGFELESARSGSNGASYTFARVAGVAVAGDGALLVSDDANGIIYRVSYRGRRGH